MHPCFFEGDDSTGARVAFSAPVQMLEKDVYLGALHAHARAQASKARAAHTEMRRGRARAQIAREESDEMQREMAACFERALLWQHVALEVARLQAYELESARVLWETQYAHCVRLLLRACAPAE